MRVRSGSCRMPIGACSEFKDKDCGRFCYYNTVEVKTHLDLVRQMGVDELAELCENGCPPGEVCPPVEHEMGFRADCIQHWVDWLRSEVVE